MRQCAVCGKSHQKSVTYRKVRSKWDPVNTRKVKANLQPTRMEDGTKAKVCVRCVRTMKKPARVRKTKETQQPTQ